MVAVWRDGVDGFHMDRALALARQGRGRTSPNPMVGAVVVSDAGEIAGSGFHARAGAAHAEVCALDEAGSLARGATLYCTLEPCAHQGRTGPCVVRIAEAGVQRVVVAVGDPSPKVNGAGIAWLRQRGIQVDVGVRRAEAARLNEAFLTWAASGRPFVTMKIATSLDGRIASQPGVRTPITGAAAVAAVHGTRAEVDAVGVGSTTLLTDDPRLTARAAPRRLPLTRIVFDRRLRTPPTARVFQTLEAGPVVVMTTAAALRAKQPAVDRLRAAGATLEALETGAMPEIMQRLGTLEITSLLLEGGTTVHRAAWAAGVVDRVQRYIAPVCLGPRGVSWVDDGLSIARLADARIRQLGPDLLMEGYVQRPD